MAASPNRGLRGANTLCCRYTSRRRKAFRCAAIGASALSNNTIGGRNTAIGRSALSLNTTGNFNTANGYQALFNNTTGNFNIALGNSAGASLTTGDSNIDIGNVGSPASRLRSASAVVRPKPLSPALVE